MKKKRFYSKLLSRDVETSETNYETTLLAETMFRISILQKKDCSCVICKSKLEELKNFLEKLESTLKINSNMKNDNKK